MTPIEYNPLGKQVKDYLPIPQPGTQDGAIYGNPLDNASAAGYGNEKIYSEKIYDNVYTNRVKQVISIGAAWAQKPIDMGYDTNINGEVKKYTITTNWLENRTDSGIALSGTYAANQLMKTTITDEDLNTTTEFKNGEGKTVLVRKNDGTKDIDTYYVYNEFGQLVYVLPPLAVATTAPDQNKLDALCYQYRYDGVGKLVEKKLPGKGWEYIIYDQQDRVILTQDANLRTTTNTFGAKGWMFTKYDKYGRVAYTGFYPSTELRSALQNSVNGITVNPANNEERSSSSFTANGIDIYYTQNAFPKINLKIISVNYYDTYASYSFNHAFPSTILNQTVITDVQNTSVNTKGLPVMSMVKNIEDDKWTKNYVYYDNKGRAIGGYSINHLGGYTKTETEFDFAGITKQSKVYHKRLVVDTEKIITQTYEYDNQNRLKKQWHQVNGQPQELLAENFYNELSQLSQKKVGNNLQSIDYTYNVRGSVIKMNDPGNLGTKLFGYELKYQNPANTSLSTGKYNGNIAEVTWKTAADQVLRRYNYQYDPLNRLKKGTYSEPNASVPENNLYNESVVYDMNSNITSLQRNGKNSVGAAGLIDNLTYTYSGNKLNTVKDSSGNYAGYPDSSGTMITYDDNGNMKNHVDKGVLQIDYNFLNLPDYVMFDKTYNPRLSGTQDAEYNVNTRYLYRADGVKLKKTYLYGSGEENLETFTITEYVDGFQYENTASIIKPTAPLTLKFVPTSEGYYNFENNKYIYSYSDHLGNVRISYTKNGAGTQIVEENNYYPFGLKHEGYNSLGGNPAYSYGYNGKELQKETGWSDYGARMYMSDIGRWGVIDPLAEQYRRLTPYNYAANNPIMFIDPDGRKIKAPDSSGEGMSLYHGATPGMVEYVGPGSRSGILKFLGLEDEMGKFYIRTDGGGGGGSFGQTQAYKDIMSGLTSSITNQNGYLYYWTNGAAGQNSIINGEMEVVATELVGHKVRLGGFDLGDYIGTAGNINDFFDSTAGSLASNAGMTRIGTNGRLYFPTVGGRVFYGNQYTRTMSLVNYGSKIGKVTGTIGYTLNGLKIAYSVSQDNWTYGKNAQVASVGVAGGMAGAWIGAKAGALVLGELGGTIGLAFEGVGALPGGIIGGFVGGVVGGFLGGYYGGDYAEKKAKQWLK